MKNFIIATLITFVSPSLAFGCEEMWFVRNLIFDRAGYCFNSPLGQAVFDNSDCQTGVQIELEPIDAEVVAMIRSNEAAEGCSINTNQTNLEFSYFNSFYQKFEQLPVPDFLESSCIGYNGAAIPVYSSPNGNALAIGFINAGDNIEFDWDDPIAGWSFVASNRTAGWISDDITYKCEMIAG